MYPTQSTNLTLAVKSSIFILVALLGTNFGSSSGSAYIYDGGKVEWILPKKDWDACAGWNVKGVDFTGWEKVRIELDPESAKLPYEIRLKQEGCDL